MFELDFRSRLPIYEQLVTKFKELIIKNILKPDEKLPSVRMLAQELTVNPNTIQKAYRELEHQKYIYSIPGKGNFVMPSTQSINTEKLDDLRTELLKIISEMLYLGMNQEEIIHLIKNIPLTDKGGREND